jgi:exoribonuclease-2
MNYHEFDLRALAHRVMIESRFADRFSAEADRESERPSRAETGDVRDLRELPWSSVDNDESLDLDQIEVAEALPEGRIQVCVAIADVDALVPLGSAIDQHAYRNTASIYLGVETFPMLPERLSTDLTSLLPGVDRLAIVTELVIDADGSVVSSERYRAVVRNQAKLIYESVGHWLDAPHAPPPAAVAAVPGMAEQIRLQTSAMERLRALRKRCGALDFETIEARAVVAPGGRVVDLTVPEKNSARFLIESFMVAVNVATAGFLNDRGVPVIQRVVRVPKRWLRIVELAESLGHRLPAAPDPRALSEFLDRRRQADPLRFPDLSLAVVKLLGSGEYALVRGGDAETAGHFGLAVRSYTHSTAPNRRFPDLVTQRMLKAVLAGAPLPYSTEELQEIAAHCTEREDAAAKVERRMRKAAAAVLMAHRIGSVFEGIVTGASDKGTYVRLLAPPVEGRVVRHEAGMDVGDRVYVRLIRTDPEQGFVDFVRA